jgi:hypothetical protein
MTWFAQRAWVALVGLRHLLEAPSALAPQGQRQRAPYESA